MSDYGITNKGFVLKRMDTILEEIHSDLTEGFEFDTRLQRPSFLDVLVTTFAGQIADLWETAQDSYYAKYPATATGINLDNAVQYGGIRRETNQRSVYPLHCTGEDGTFIREEATVATNTSPEIRLYAANEFQITREAFNSVDVAVAVLQASIYTVTINGEQYNYTSADVDEAAVIQGLKAAITNSEYVVTVEDGNTLRIVDTIKTRNNTLVLSDNLTTRSVTTIAQFFTEEYGRIVLPTGIVTKMINNITGFESVINLLEPTYGRMAETDIELRQSYIGKSAIRSTRMIDSICSQLINNVPNVESATGYENNTDYTDEEGRPPHSVEIIVDGGDETKIASIILDKKAAGIQTFGKITVSVATKYGDSVPISFNRPEYVYVWMKVTLDAEQSYLPTNYANLVVNSIIKDALKLQSGDNMLSQTFNDGIYSTVGGVTYIDIKCASTTSKDHIPANSEYTKVNVPITSRQKAVISDTRIEVVYSGHS